MKKGTALVSGMVAGDPGYGGASWAVLQYVLGLQRLGWDVWLVEPVGELTQPRTEYFADVVSAFELESRSALLEAGTHSTFGVPYTAIRAAAIGADLLLNVSGMLADPALLDPVPTRVYLDLDPAFNQLWHARGEADMRFAAHTHFVTVGLNLGQPECTVPTLGLTWLPLLPPVVLDRWPVADPVPEAAFTTVGNWRSYGAIHHEEVHYGQKAHAFRELVELPERTTQRFDVALAIDPSEVDDINAFAAHGWNLVDPVAAAGTPARYAAFIAGSKAEIGIPKAGYARSRCGWFSDRSACYLASGRPVVAQETGFSAVLPAGEGLLAFETLDGAVAAVEDVHRAYARHAAAARALAETYLDSDRVLTALLDYAARGRNA